MDTLFDYRIPVLHPWVVHFPVALLLIAVVAAAVWLATGRAFWRRTTLFLVGFGLAGAFFAYFTGEAMEEQSEGVPVVEELVGLHETLALYTLIAAGASLLGLAGASFWLERRTTIERHPPDPPAVRAVLFALVLAAAVLVALTAHAGGTMVWGVAR